MVFFCSQGFPTLILFRKGIKVENYQGPRNHDGIVAYMRKVTEYKSWNHFAFKLMTLYYLCQN